MFYASTRHYFSGFLLDLSDDISQEEGFINIHKLKVSRFTLLSKTGSKMFTPLINHNKYNTRFDRVVLFISQYRTTIIGYFGHPVYFLSQLFKKPANAV